MSTKKRKRKEYLDSKYPLDDNNNNNNNNDDDDDENFIRVKKKQKTGHNNFSLSDFLTPNNEDVNNDIGEFDDYQEIEEHYLKKEEKKIKKKKKNKKKKSKNNFQYRKKVNIEMGKYNTGIKQTVSIALPGSIIKNAQSKELKTYLAGQIARALSIFQINEVIIFNEEDDSVAPQENLLKSKNGKFQREDPNLFLARLLQYLECPQYLRKSFFPFHKDLQFVGLLNPLDTPHHMRRNEWHKYREGVVVPDHSKKQHNYSLVNAGLIKFVRIDKEIPVGTRVTLEMDESPPISNVKHYTAEVVSPTKPRTNDGIYWGYNVRLANNLTDVFNCPFTENHKYDLTLGTSERGEHIDQFKLPVFNNLLIVFGGLKGLEESVVSDENLVDKINNPRELFNHYLNTCPNQGSRTIRTEEAILITLSNLRTDFQSVFSKYN